MRYSVLSILLLGPWQAKETLKPRELLAVQSARTAFRTAYIEWWEERFEERERREAGPRKFYALRIAGDEQIYAERGDSEGVHLRDVDGNPLPMPRNMNTTPRQVLAYHGKRWDAWQAPAGARIASDPQRAPIWDVRSLGLFPWFRPNEDPADALWGMGGARTYATTQVDKLCEVQAECADGYTLTWTLDPDRGWSPVRVALIQKGEVTAECRSVPEQFGHTWFPKRAEFFRRDYKHGVEPYSRIEVTAATFDDPEHPPHLTPENVGVEPGTNIIKEPEGKEPAAMVYWDGRRLLSQEEWSERIRSGNAELGPRFRAAVQEAKERNARWEASGYVPILGFRWSPSKGAEFRIPATYFLLEDEWTRFTEAFIHRHKLDTGQAEAARSILRSCIQRREDYLGTRRADFETLVRREKELETPGKERVQEKRAELAAERERLQAPIRNIFEQELKPRLDTIPTDAQRRESAPYTPVSVPMTQE